MVRSKAFILTNQTCTRCAPINFEQARSSGHCNFASATFASITTAFFLSNLLMAAQKVCLNNFSKFRWIISLFHLYLNQNSCRLYHHSKPPLLTKNLHLNFPSRSITVTCKLWFYKGSIFTLAQSNKRSLVF